MKTTAYYSGKIETKNRECFVGNQKVDCPGSQEKNSTQTGDKLDILPPSPILDKRGDFVFTSIILLVVIGYILLAVFKTRVFGKTLAEYVKPVWYFILISILIVLWQYLFGLRLDDNLMALRISQWLWQALVLASAYKLSKLPGTSYGNMLFLGILYSTIIHGLKVAIRYYFYDKTLLYTLDRFLYGSLLVMVFAFVLGSVFVYLKRRGIRY
ncbi:hypothetical protein A3H89_01435 [Candidatus Amesbacteria bacterium RIFCSPLOWO2_02_FULL_48_11]|uniref:Uncharacterized protein n=5 Tax=Candidatus Amesiibacteriota TaxID=1752730 RepID=A0A1F4ZDX7_9BACT|nr:MAG: hypothetical protein UX78_C0019G0006 [Candidatus Amesbacteria bacterium GW2011_GWA2_47_11]KKU93836.1 MAG: hypothetical protein UY22_C0016G0021 [Candidatus Amesbacteria bacterium GW2011_GWC1_48_10]KKU99628.1 MAG: hypothetical protein UY33_C0026G0006 [Candidatus Amesbacteria bacterium GW2011_GWA1_48_9]OGC90150.1 MAG: hypothetical protein A2V48_01095 [Candidatus Amesbacteria bacterium RBG_19FT_COMBO_48_16]OGC96443.1 MAG: hypothetical protein A3C34_03005 [Candidatus Amesbacteria bacterium R